MGSGTLLQIVSYGGQVCDVYLTGNPQMSYFKFVFRRHTNFATESVPLDFNAPVNCPQVASKKNSKNIYSCIIPHNFDLLLGLTLEVVIHITNKAEQSLVKHPGWNLIDFVDFNVGGVSLDKQTGDWMHLWHQSHDTLEQRLKIERLTNLSLGNGRLNLYKLYLPLPLFFTKNAALALPMLALRHNEVKLHVKFNNISALFRKFSTVSNAYIHETRVYSDVAYLAPETKHKFLETPLMYNIEQIQYNTVQIPQKRRRATVDLHFNHPVKQLIFTCQDSARSPRTQTSITRTVTALPIMVVIFSFQRNLCSTLLIAWRSVTPTTFDSYKRCNLTRPTHFCQTWTRMKMATITPTRFP